VEEGGKGVFPAHCQTPNAHEEFFFLGDFDTLFVAKFRVGSS
jgi:hypothetical protein